MGKRCRHPLEHGRRCGDDERLDSMNPDNDAYDDVMGIYADPSDSDSEHYDCNEEDEDDI
jgi:hypothetical protein